MQQVQSRLEWEQSMSEKILTFVRNELYMELRYLDAALSAMPWQGREDLSTFATDGRVLYYSMEQLLRVFPDNPKFLDRAYLHATLHCIFAHLWLRGARERETWNLACDIVVESIIDGLGKECTKRPLSWMRQKTYAKMRQENWHSAAEVYSYVKAMEDGERQLLAKEFYTDSHRYWPEEEKGGASPNAARDMWDKLSRQSQMEMERRGQEPEEEEGRLAKQLRAQKSRRSYKEFLRKFAVLREEMHCDPEEFDLNSYTYGLQLYGNMPLIEPLESRETMKIQEFVVVVDTSYSTDGELVKSFLRETFGLLTEADSFFQKCHIRILQCDDRVQMDEKITNLDELERLLQRFTLVGGGGTDFRPAFAYVNQLRDSGELGQLRGMLYFTDGKGTYPAKRPDYDTAFLFLEEYDESQVPPWAMRMRLYPEELLNDRRQETKV